LGKSGGGGGLVASTGARLTLASLYLHQVPRANRDESFDLALEIIDDLVIEESRK